MAIDADLSSGFIDEDQARQRRKDLETQYGFFGSMDGASKFVRGDAIAGLLITFINIIGGFVIGVAQQDLSVAEAGRTYTVLTVGDGLVSQVPALLVSTAAGLLITKSSDRLETHQSLVFSQLSLYPTALYVAGFLLALMSAVPGLPPVPFLVLALTAAGGGYLIARRQKQKTIEEEADTRAAEAETDAESDDPVSAALTIDSVRLELGYGLLALINEDHDQQLPKQIKALRRQLARDFGFVMPAVRIQDNLQLPAQ